MFYFYYIVLGIYYIVLLKLYKMCIVNILHYMLSYTIKLINIIILFVMCFLNFKF